MYLYSMITERHQRDPKGIHIEVLRWSNMIQTIKLKSVIHETCKPTGLWTYGLLPENDRKFLVGKYDQQR